MAVAPGTRWAADPLDDYRFEALGEFDLIYHRPSGQTHLLAGDAVAIIGLLVDGASDEADLAQRLAKHMDVEPVGDFADRVAARIDELASAGLIAAT